MYDFHILPLNNLTHKIDEIEDFQISWLGLLMSFNLALHTIRTFYEIGISLGTHSLK